MYSAVWRTGAAALSAMCLLAILGASSRPGPNPAMSSSAPAFVPNNQNEKAPMSTRPYLTWFGPHSKITQPEFVRITTAEQWLSLWKRHRGADVEISLTGEPIAPAVDFDSCMVLAFFRGPDRENNGEAGASWIETDALAVLRFDPERFQTRTPAGAVDPDRYQGAPFGIFVVPRTPKAVSMEENIQRYIGLEPIWEEKHRFPALP